MAHWAQVDENNIVINITVGNNEDPAGDEGYSWLINNIGGTWIKTSYNTYGGVHYSSEKDENGADIPSGRPHLRYNYACIGYTYDPIRDAFIPPKPFNSWVLNENTCLWKPPIPYPSDDKNYFWNEDIINWEEVAQ